MACFYGKYGSRCVQMVSRTLLIIIFFVCLDVGDFRQNNAKLIRSHRGRVTMIPEFASLCPNQRLATSRADFQVENVGRLAIVVNGVVLLDRDLRPFTMIVIQLENCEDRNEGTCQHFQTVRLYNETCTLMEKKDAFYSPIIKSFDPKMKCPLAAGRYVMRNGTLDVNLLQLLPVPLEKYLWRFKIEAFDPERVTCVQGAARFLRART